MAGCACATLAYKIILHAGLALTDSSRIDDHGNDRLVRGIRREQVDHSERCVFAYVFTVRPGHVRQYNDFGGETGSP